jgi:hypothetical protein
MRWQVHTAAVLVLVAAGAPPACPDGAKSPSFVSVPEISSGFRLMYEQNFAGAREKFDAWKSQNPEEPLGEIAIAASYLFEELYRQGALSSDFFLNEKRFLHGIEGKPDAERMKSFQDALDHARRLAKDRMQKDKKDPEAFFALTLASGMESNADIMLKKQHIDALKRLKESNEYAKQLLTEEPEANDAYVALGTANYVIGSLSGGTRFFLMFGGIHGDKKLGMLQLGKTIDGGRYLQPFAKILLALASRREKQDPKAQQLLLELSQEFPESPLYAAEYAKAMGRPIPAAMNP